MNEKPVRDAQAEADWIEVTGNELVIALTRAMRLADRAFEQVGGSTRHHVRDCLIPELEAMGLHIVVSLPVPLEATKAWDGEDGEDGE